MASPSNETFKKISQLYYEVRETIEEFYGRPGVLDPGQAVREELSKIEVLFSKAFYNVKRDGDISILSYDLLIDLKDRVYFFEELLKSRDGLYRYPLKTKVLEIKPITSVGEAVITMGQLIVALLPSGNFGYKENVVPVINNDNDGISKPSEPLDDYIIDEFQKTNLFKISKLWILANDAIDQIIKPKIKYGRLFREDYEIDLSNMAEVVTSYISDAYNYSGEVDFLNKISKIRGAIQNLRYFPLIKTNTALVSNSIDLPISKIRFPEEEFNLLNCLAWVDRLALKIEQRSYDEEELDEEIQPTIISQIPDTLLGAAYTSLIKDSGAETISPANRIIKGILATSEVAAEIVNGKISPIEGPGGIFLIGSEEEFEEHLEALRQSSLNLAGDFEEAQVSRATCKLFRRYATTVNAHKIVWCLADDFVESIRAARPDVWDGWPDHSDTQVRSLVARHREIRSYLKRQKFLSDSPPMPQVGFPKINAEISEEIDLIIADPEAKDELSESGALFLGHIALKVKSADANEVKSGLSALAGFIFSALDNLDKFGEKHKGFAAIIGMLTQIAGLLMKLFGKG